MHDRQESFHLKLLLLLSHELKQSSEGIYKTRGLQLSPDCLNFAGSRLKRMCFIADETMRCASRQLRLLCQIFPAFKLLKSSVNLFALRLKVLPPSHRTKIPNKFKWRLQRHQHVDLHEGLRLSDPSQINKKDHDISHTWTWAFRTAASIEEKLQSKMKRLIKTLIAWARLS